MIEKIALFVRREDRINWMRSEHDLTTTLEICISKHGLPSIVFAWFFFLLNKNACSIDNGVTCFYIMS